MFRALSGAAAPAAPSQQAAKGCEQCGQTAAQDWSGDAARREITTIARGAAAAARELKIVAPGGEEGGPGRKLAEHDGSAPLCCRDRTDHHDIVGIVDDAVKSGGPHRSREVADEVRWGGKHVRNGCNGYELRRADQLERKLVLEIGGATH